MVITGVVDTLNVADVEPAGTVTVAGTVADALFEDIVQTTPPVGAGLLNVTVPTGALPPTTPLVLSVKLCRLWVVNVRAALADVLLAVAEIFAVAVAATTLVVTVKVADVAPAATETVPGTVADVESDASVTV